KDIAVLAKKVYELSTLRVDELDGRKWEALLIVNAVLSSATPDGIAKANADKEARWGDAIRKEGMLAAFHPKWLLRTDDGKPPAIKHALESALDNPNRDLRTRLQALQFIAPADREPLTDLVKALEADAYAGARGDARDQFLSVMHNLSNTWFREPWLMVLPYDGNPPPVSILIENQGPTHDGGWHDDPSDDTEWEKVKFGLRDAIITWDTTWLRDNPFSDFYLTVESVTSAAVDTSADVASGLNDAAKALAKIVRWAPYVLGGVVVLGLGAVALSFRRRAS
ncbi:MAG: hypothetical protein KC420_19045, partial [Myxococcales bacterium]|nr:hypothetical protein [Myxococcales bacterium]